MIKHKELMQLLSYNPMTGEFRWLVKRKSTHPVGSLAGWVDKLGYRIICINQKDYLSGRLAYFYMTKRWPKDTIDHIDRNPRNDRWNNLRPATRSQNQMNRIGKKIAFKGATYMPRRQKPWLVRVNAGRVAHFVGYFKTERVAHRAYLAALRDLHGEYACAASVGVN